MERRVIEITAELIAEEEGGYTVYCPELDIYTQGEDIEDALANLKEAAELHIEKIGVQSLKLRKVEHRAPKIEVHAQASPGYGSGAGESPAKGRV